MSELREAVHEHSIWADRMNFIMGVILPSDDEDDEGWESEQLTARKLGDGLYELCCIPFFAYDLALGDVVALDDRHNVKEVVRPSGRRVFRVFFREADAFDRVIHRVHEMGGLMEAFSERLLAIDAADQALAQRIADYLQEEEDAGAIEYETGLLSR
jgi:hypothetical protein